MGTSTDGQLCYGYLFDEGHEFPWYSEDDFGDLEMWWEEQNGYVELPLEREPYTEDGDYQEWFKKLSRDEQDKYLDPRWEHHRKWVKDNPIPFDLVNYCSGDCPMYILAVPSTVITANRGYPERIVSLPEIKGIKQFTECLQKYGIHDCIEQPSWYLSSYMG